ncbi:MAG: REP-associated tyrosine transposase [Gaiellaceae bacterium]
MALRVVDPFGYYHLNANGNFGRSLYEEEVHRRVFLHIYERVARKCGWVTLAYCLMTTHYHLVIRLTDGGLSKGMQQLNGGFSRRMNAIYERTGKGHLFKQRFHDERIEDEPHLLASCRYVVLNPVAAGICRRPEEWPWSSYRASAGLDFPPPFLAVDALLALFGTRPHKARSAYAAFVRDGLASSSDQGGRRVPAK